MEPTSAEDEIRLQELAATLGAGLEAAIAPWLVTAARARAAAAGRVLAPAEHDRVAAAAAAAAVTLTPRVHAALTADVDAGAPSPLAVIRAGLDPFTEVLVELGLPAPPRDEFARRAFPSDVYDLAPAAFADIDDALREPGLMWGAARAHVHLRRRRDADRSAP